MVFLSFCSKVVVAQWIVLRCLCVCVHCDARGWSWKSVSAFPNATSFLALFFIFPIYLAVTFCFDLNVSNSLVEHARRASDKPEKNELTLANLVPRLESPFLGLHVNEMKHIRMCTHTRTHTLKLDKRTAVTTTQRKTECENGNVKRTNKDIYQAINQLIV